MSEFQVTCILEEDSAFELLLTLFFNAELFTISWPFLFLFWVGMDALGL